MIAGGVATAAAETPVLNIHFNDGSTKSFKIEDIAEMTFGSDYVPGAADIAGNYTGKNTVVVGGSFSYSADVTVTVTANADGTVNFTWPEYKLPGTVMGDLTLGSYTISNLAYDKDKGGFFADYGKAGLSMHLKTEQGGQVTMDKDYALLDTSTILIKITDTGTFVVENPFKLGAMPMTLVATFEGAKE